MKRISLLLILCLLTTLWIAVPEKVEADTEATVRARGSFKLANNNEGSTNNSFDTAKVIEKGTSVMGSLAGNNESYFYKITVSGDEEATLILKLWFSDYSASMTIHNHDLEVIGGQDLGYDGSEQSPVPIHIHSRKVLTM